MRDTSTWYKDGYFWVDPTEKWADELYGYKTNNKFDLIFNTCDKILMDQDTSAWAFNAVLECYRLLMKRGRWPERMDHPMDSQTKLECWVGNILFWMKLIPHKSYGHVKRMSRDPFIAVLTASIFLGLKTPVKNLNLPWYLYRPNTWTWRKRLLKDNRKDYIKHLDYLRAKAIVLKHEG